MSCYSPFYVDNPAYNINRTLLRQVPVPCGKCPPCLKRRSNGWAFRLQKEELKHSGSSFVTLTYDNEHITITPKKFMTLVKKDFQDFMKRLRKLHPNETKLKYWACGEYGSTTVRPHYHAIIYNLDSAQLAKAWTKGIVHIGSVSGASIAYTTKYMHKGKRIPMHSNDDRIPEFSLMSKRLGSNYLSSETIQFHQDDITRNYLTLPGGVKIALPRYYREKIFTKAQMLLQALTVEDSTEKALASSLQRFKERTKSTEGHDFSKHQSIKHAIEEFKSVSLTNRQKL